MAHLRNKSISPTISPEAAAERLLDLVPRTIRLIRRQFRSRRPADMTLQQMRLLLRLRRGPATNAELAEHLYVSLPAVTRMVNTLVARRMASRTRDAADKRCVQIRCTAKGLAAVMELRAQVQEQLAVFCADLTPESRAVLFAGLGVLELLPIER